MRIRKPFAGAFLGLSLIAAYLGFGHIKIGTPWDKALHFCTFFVLTACFYWILETSRRRAVNLTIIVCLGFGAIGSEFVQGLLPYRQFDPMDIVANLLGSTTSLLLMQWYHNRMLERRRLTRGRYGPVATEDAQEPDLEAGSELQDMGSNHEQEEELPAVKTPP